MKWLIFGDVHGNLPALEALLKKEKGNYDAVACHGDLVNYGPWSNECVQVVNNITNAVCLKGNHEEYFINGVYPGKHPVAQAFFEFCYPHYEEFGLIQKFGSSYEIGGFTLQHTILNKYIFLDTIITPGEMHRNFIIGHSHQQYQRSVELFKLINTGSLGQNRLYINVAEYLIYDTEKEKTSFKSFIYNTDLIINEMLVRGYSELCLNYYRTKKRA